MEIYYKGKGELQIGDVKCMRVVDKKMKGKSGRTALEMDVPLMLIGGETVCAPDIHEDIQRSLGGGILASLKAKGLIEIYKDGEGPNQEYNLEGPNPEAKQASPRATPVNGLDALTQKIDTLTNAVSALVELQTKKKKKYGKYKRTKSN